MLLVKVKDFNALIDNKPFFDQPLKSKQEAYEKLLQMSRNYDHTTRNLLDFSYHQADIRQTNTNIPQKINFTGKLEEDNDATTFSIAEKQQKKVLNFSIDSLIVTKNINNGTSKNIKFIE